MLKIKMANVSKKFVLNMERKILNIFGKFWKNLKAMNAYAM